MKNLIEIQEEVLQILSAKNLVFKRDYYMDFNSGYTAFIISPITPRRPLTFIYSLLEKIPEAYIVFDQTQNRIAIAEETSSTVSVKNEDIKPLDVSAEKISSDLGYSLLVDSAHIPLDISVAQKSSMQMPALTASKVVKEKKIESIEDQLRTTQNHFLKSLSLYLLREKAVSFEELSIVVLYYNFATQRFDFTLKFTTLADASSVYLALDREWMAEVYNDHSIDIHVKVSHAQSFFRYGKVSPPARGPIPLSKRHI